MNFAPVRALLTFSDQPCGGPESAAYPMVSDRNGILKGSGPDIVTLSDDVLWQLAQRVSSFLAARGQHVPANVILEVLRSPIESSAGAPSEVLLINQHLPEVEVDFEVSGVNA